jgi:hypothetical protein
MARVFWLTRGKREDATDFSVSKNDKGEVRVSLSRGTDRTLVDGFLRPAQAREAGAALIAEADAVEAAVRAKAAQPHPIVTKPALLRRG